ncbi:UNVERIFIED_CONTAM: hypothetical protein PYX00_004284 [Menopon gallinae]|uniref:Branchpoint-bridging protein n=1 Tax=Menopon gallinae TaxID=328185 RepID=A0AAW2I508_9NEOP
MTKMAILGRGSMRDKHKEEELRLSGDPKFSHLHEDLHVEITAFAPPAEAHARIAYALADVRRFLVPDYNDDIRQEQMWEMQILKEQPENSPIINDGLGLHVLGTTIPIVPTSTGTTSPTNSNGSQSPHTPPSGILDANGGAPIMLPAQHPALRGVAAVQGVKTCIPVTFVFFFWGVGPVTGRKRPLMHTTKHALSPTKRTVMSILARARAAQGKEIPGYHVNG